ncbi:MAG: transcription elongation factor GreA [Lachnospiraceae bacterium]|nr:transcription elongation factor GreA [Lachnospiraceae bacterium]
MHDRLTQGDIDKMQEEIDERRLKLQPELIKAVQEARAQGDLSENFEYYAAKREKRQNESRIRYLENMIKTAILIEDHAAADEVSMNKSIEVYFPEDDETEVFRIVTTIRGNSLKNLISIESPLGRALLHHHVGDTVHVKVDDRSGYDVVIKGIGVDEGEDADTIRSF